MTVAILRKELQGYIAAMPKCNLSMLKPLLSGLAKPPCTIEPASPEECVRIEKRVREYHENPASFVSLKNRKARQVLEKTGEPENGESTQGDSRGGC